MDKFGTVKKTISNLEEKCRLETAHDLEVKNEIESLYKKLLQLDIDVESNNEIILETSKKILVKQLELTIFSFKSLSDLSLSIQNNIKNTKRIISQLEKKMIKFDFGQMDFKDILIELEERKKFMDTDYEFLEKAKTAIEENYPTLSELKELLKNIKREVPITNTFSKNFYKISELTVESKNAFVIYTDWLNKKIEKTNQERINQEIKNNILKKNKLEEEKRFKEEKEKALPNKEAIIDLIKTPEEVTNVVEEEVITDLAIIIFDNFKVGNSIDHINTLLPKKESNLYFKEKKSIMKIFKDNLEKLDKQINQVIPDDILNSIIALNDAVEYLNKYFENEEKEENKKEIVDFKVNNLFFSTRSNGEFYLPFDLKSDDLKEREFQEATIKFLLQLRYGEESWNTQKCKKLSNNRKLKNVFELKDFQIRLIYKHLGSNNYFIEMVCRKKSDKDRQDINKIACRINIVEQEYQEIKKLIANNSIDNELLKNNNDLFNDITASKL